MYRALRVDSTGTPGELIELDDAALPEGDVDVDVEYSSLNYKDGLALAGRPGVVRSFPLTAGIDLVGTVTASTHASWAAGDRVILNGFGIGETHDGGLAERARVRGDWLVRLPETMDARRAAAIGTAGYTAMLSVLALERHGVMRGDILVTGAAGGVGSIAVALLAKLGHRVVASTGREQEHDYLRSLGAAEVVGRLGEPGKPLQSQRWAGAIDSVGSHTLANVLAQANDGGIVAACGLAQGGDLPTTVMPFILRAVTLVGINSVHASLALREVAWARLATDLDPQLLDSLTREIGLRETLGLADTILDGGVRGRTVVDVRA